MKLSKILLGIITGILAVAGAAVAKRITGIQRYYCTQCPTHYCEMTNSKFFYTSTDPVAGTPVTTIVSNCHAGTVNVPVYTKGVANSPCSSSNCIHQLVNVGN